MLSKSYKTNLINEAVCYPILSYVLTAINKYGMTINEKTKKLDCDHSVKIEDDFIVDGTFALPLGTIKGNFICSNLEKLTNLKNAPDQVYGNFDCSNSPNLRSKDGISPVIKGKFICNGTQICESRLNRSNRSNTIFNEDVENGKFRIPTFITIMANLYEKYGLILNPKTRRVDSIGDVKIDRSFVDQNGKFNFPFGVIKGNFICSNIDTLETLQNGPTEVFGDFNCSGCENLTSLIGSPKIVHGDFDCSYTNIISSDGKPSEIDGEFIHDGTTISECRSSRSCRSNRLRRF